MYQRGKGPCCSRCSGSGWIRIDFGGLDPDPHWESGSLSRMAKKTQKLKKVMKFRALKSWMFSFEG